MGIDAFDTYATGPDGSLVHVDVRVPEGTKTEAVTRIIREFAGASDPEIETQKRRGKSRDKMFLSDLVVNEARMRGFCIVPLQPPRRAAA
ncbi:hypothetical protein Mal15_18340 [Stieleria maiorica]|uniref:Uncharacterized protein n=1 Tax=Stieleria maiorica TaxID=2795974 RepID=A0A5B9MCW9_9BACT|nr:DUF2024 family protein [Stieleria maiorica]QEF97790.1 hypothetical protein Mal15_18340 [Stieleria maiorica]